MADYKTRSWKRHGKSGRLWNRLLSRGILKNIFLVVILLGIMGSLGVLGAFAFYSRNLPDPAQLTERKISQTTKIYDRTGEHLLYEVYGDQNRTLVKTQEGFCKDDPAFATDPNGIPLRMLEATITAEDRGFCTHPGYDVKGLMRAVLFGGTRGGGSTLTQQLVKNAILSNEKRISRKKKGGRNRRKAAQRAARAHARVARQRTDFLHKLSFHLARHYGFIAVEALNIRGMVKNHRLAKHISDASWGRFIQMLAYKAVTAGGQLIPVAARDTSQLCSKCGNKTTIGLGQRTFACARCGLSLGRDINAARNILARATAGPAGSHACGDQASTLPLQKGGASQVAEAGTICGNVS